jgi:hypothetical protein
VQGLNMTAAHGHAALFGVYGMLGIGLMLFCLRGLYERHLHADNLLKPAFWSLNIGLAMMVFLSLLPAGIYQAWASISKGLWYARSAEVIHSPVMETLVWMRCRGQSALPASWCMPWRCSAPRAAGRQGRRVLGRPNSAAWPYGGHHLGTQCPRGAPDQARPASFPPAE